MAQGTTPVVQRRLRAQLRKAREDAGYTQKQAAEAMDWSVSKLIRLETGATAVSTADAMALIHFYKIEDQARVENLIAVARSKAAAWWDEYSTVYPPQFLTFLAYEDAAVSIRQFQGWAIPGLLQTGNYALELFRRVYQLDTDRIERAVRVRARRGELLKRADNSTKFDFILDEAVIHRVVANTDVVIEQLTRLKELNDVGNPLISIRIVPFTAGVTPGMKGSFTILELSSEDEDFVVNVEEPNSDVLIRDNPEATSNYVEAFLELEEIALPRAESSELLDSVIRTLRSNPPS